MRPRPLVNPHQSKISVQDVPNKGAEWAHENEEMRRIQLTVNNLIDKVEKPVDTNAPQRGSLASSGGTTGGGGGSSTTTGEQELSVLHNDWYVSEKTVRELNFIDPDTWDWNRQKVDIKFWLKEVPLTTDPIRTQVTIEATGMTDRAKAPQMMIEKNFTYIDFESGKELQLGYIEANSRIDSVYLNIKGAMSDGELEVYTVPNNLLVLPGSVVPITIVNNYHKNYTILTMSDSWLYLRFIGNEPTRGIGTITIFYHKVQ